ncbi:MAG: hypothetical protein KIT87_19670 [Anaerolineae bacterium]|nr:hypothetical protein [Anaerolineae bacterium]
MAPSSPPMRGFFTYPWHLVHEPVQTTLAQMRDRYLCNAIAVAGSYHSGTFLTPRLPHSLISQRQNAMLSFQPNLELYAPEGPWPLVDGATAEEGILDQVRLACEQLEMQMNIWLVVLHSSALGQAHPDLCQQNVVGDRYSYSLCPAFERVRAYAVGLVRDVCAQFHPHTLLLESATFMPALHGGHHEIVLLPVNPLVQWLLSLCFCPACVERAEAAQVDVGHVQAETRRLLNALLDEEGSGLPPTLRWDDMSGILVEFPHLQAYADVRIATVMSLLSELSQAANRYGTRVEVIPNTGVRPIARSWMLGVSLSGLRDAADGAMVLGYYPDAADVEAELRTLRLLSDPLPFSVALNVGYHQTATPGALTARALVSAQGGARGLFYYNWSLLSERRLAWVREANQAVLNLRSVIP